MSRGLNQLEGFIEEKLLHLHTQTVAMVMKVNGDDTWDVQPLIQTKEIDDDAGEDLPLLLDVPGLFQRVKIDGAKQIIQPDWKVGDIVWLGFGERAIEYAIKGNKALPADYRHHSLNDAVILGGFNIK